MDNRAWASGASATPPTEPASPSTGYPSSGVLGVEAPTVPGAFWFHQMGEELRAVLTAAGVTPDTGSLDQLLTSLQALFGAPIVVSGTRVGVKLPGGLQLLWKSTAFSDVAIGTPGEVVSVTLPNGGFPTACILAIPSIEVTSGDINNYGCGVISKSATTVGVQIQEWSAATNPGTLVLLALGY